jgi:hypothetical protein
MSNGGGAFGKEDSLTSARTWLSAKVTIVSSRQRLTALCREPPFAECYALGKEIVPRVLLSANAVVTERRTLPSATLGKGFFAECPTKCRALGKGPDSGSVFSYTATHKLAYDHSYSFQKSNNFVKILRCEREFLFLRSDFYDGTHTWI